MKLIMSTSCTIRRNNTDYQEIQQWIADGGTVIDNPQNSIMNKEEKTMASLSSKVKNIALITA